MRDIAGRGGAVADLPRGGVRGGLVGVLPLPRQHGEPELVVGGIVHRAVAVGVVRPRCVAQAPERGLVRGAGGHAGQRLIGGKVHHGSDPLAHH